MLNFELEGNDIFNLNQIKKRGGLDFFFMPKVSVDVLVPPGKPIIYLHMDTGSIQQNNN